MVPPLSLDQLAAAAAEADRLVAAVRPDEWPAPTPCADWDARALVTHVTTGTEQLAAALASALAPPAAPPAAPAVAEGDDGRDLAAAHRASVEALLAAASAPGALEATVTIPFGTVPALMALHLRVIEFLVHGWDLGRATGRPTAFPAPLAELELAVSRAALAQLPPDRRPFAPSRPAPADGPPLDQLAALLGRHP
jgi:uncharacterized protein (TIGR03086 family)